MFAIVRFDFIGNPYSPQKYIFKTDVENLVEGDIVVVEGINVGESILAVFVRYQEQDDGENRKLLLKKAHKNTLKSLMRKRVELFKNVEIPRLCYHHYRTQFKNNGGLSDLEIKQKIIRNICVSPSIAKNKKGTVRYFFGGMRISIRDNEIVSLVKIGIEGWVRPKVLEQIAEEYIAQEFEKELAIEMK